MTKQPATNNTAEQTNTAQPTAGHIDAINQLFTELQLAYHNQFHKAWADEEQLTMAKQLWLNALADLSPKQIVAGGHRSIKESEYLPTLHSIRKCCVPNPAELGLPDAHAAYLEACQAPSPRNEYKWSHPAVYFAGRESDWFFISSNPESKAFPVFKRNYELLCERILKGEELELPLAKALPEEIHQPLSNAERKERLQTLRKELDL
jgi:hypothetical protein